MAKIAVDLSEGPSPVEELVRDIEESGYPVDFSREEAVRQPDVLSMAPDIVGTVPRLHVTAQTKRTTPRDRSSSPRSVGHDPDSLPLTELTEELIRRMAYQFYEERGYADGHDLDDWLRAEEQVLGKRPPP